MVAHTCNPNIWEAKAGALGVQEQPELLSKFEVSLVCMKLFLKSEIMTKMTHRGGTDHKSYTML